MTFNNFLTNLVKTPSLPLPTAFTFEKDDPSNRLGEPFVRYVSGWDLFKTQTKVNEVINRVKSGPTGYAGSLEENIERILEDLFPFAISSIVLKNEDENEEKKLRVLLGSDVGDAVINHVRDEVVLLCKLFDDGAFDECMDKTLDVPKATICLVIDILCKGSEKTSDFFDEEDKAFFLNNDLEEPAAISISYSAVIVFADKGTDTPRPLTKEQYNHIVVPHKTKVK